VEGSDIAVTKKFPVSGSQQSTKADSLGEGARRPDDVPERNGRKP